MIKRSSADFLLIEGMTLQELFGCEDPQDARANPITYKLTFETIHDDAERSQSADMPRTLPTILNRKAKVEVTWNKLPIEWAEKLCGYLNLVYKDDAFFSTEQNVPVTYRDITGVLRTMNAYVGPTIDCTYVVDVTGQDYWDGVRLAFIEK